MDLAGPATRTDLRAALMRRPGVSPRAVVVTVAGLAPETTTDGARPARSSAAIPRDRDGMLENAEVMRLSVAASLTTGWGDRPEDVRRTRRGAKWFGLSGSVEDGPARLHYVRTGGVPRGRRRTGRRWRPATLMGPPRTGEQRPRLAGQRAGAAGDPAVVARIDSSADSDLDEHRRRRVLLRDLTEAEAAAADSADRWWSPARTT
ncbi:hypothetical protein GCM10020358_60750 [Amorphoplanes nipponensis]|uniref:hypothetical protein n=1 Tax=Actinoplanes nipponensis TaxID=135950 RepID=UPI0031F01D71